MNETIKILTIQDISCYGQCSITVALPIVSAFGIETAILPSAVLSTHTAGFTDFTVRDLTEDLPEIRKHWEKEGILFDAIYTGFIASIEQLDYIKDIIDSILHKPWKEEFTKEEMLEMANELSEFTKRHVILKGDTHKEGQLGMIVLDKEEETCEIVFNEKVDYVSHGTGDVFASAFVGSTMNGKTPTQAAKIAGEFTKRAIEKTIGDENHTYGVKFEQVIPELYDLLKKY